MSGSGETSDQLRAQHARLRLVHEEVDRLVIDVTERANSVANKASFLAVAAGVLVTATTAQLWTLLAWFGIVALGLAAFGLICAATALRPGKRFGLVAQRLADTYLDSMKSAMVIETEILRSKTTAITQRERDIVQRANCVWIGFASLVLSASALTSAFAVQVLKG